jgi:hypothetical protein
MTLAIQYPNTFDVGVFEQLPGFVAGGNRKPLPCEGMTVFEASIAYVPLSAVDHPGQLPCHPICIGRTLFHPQPQVITFTFGMNPRDFLDSKILWAEADQARGKGRTERVRPL